MSLYLNIGNEGFVSARNGEYVDKSGLIAVINSTFHTEHRFSCVTRCRRFGKSMAAKMLSAYYDNSCDSRHLFKDLEIARHPSFEKYLNKYPVIYLDVSAFITRFKENELVSCIQEELTKDVLTAYPDVDVAANDDFMAVLTRIAVQKKQQFVLIIDEWDAICREYAARTDVMDNYVNWLRRMFKEVNATTVFACVYMTGILPIKKYKTESALNNFTEYSMVNPGKLDRYFGFTATEVRLLCQKHNMDYDEMSKWYDGYKLGSELSMFNPNSVMMALWEGRCRSFWASTGSYDAVAAYIQMNFDELKDNVIKMLAGGRCVVDPSGFQNDMSVIKSRNDALTVLIHLGYLAYEWETSECYTPNREVEGELINAVNSTNWRQLITSIEQSRKLLQSTLDGDEQAVAQGIDAAHDENTSILSYNNENSLACVLSIAYYYARNDYAIVRELPTGKGFADLVLIPRKGVNKPAIVLELKYDKAADTAICQIKRKEYAGKVSQLTSNVLLVGINYDKASKKHTCRIEHVSI
ncbi:MAG: AAA family ATPase [Prevotella sp.]|nr:AAA family ATPase [Prevotella sp.]